MHKHRTIPVFTDEEQDLFWAKVDVPYQPSMCWQWTGAITRHGYGTHSLHANCLLAHRLAYTFLIGPIPNQMVIDHLCKNKSCMNPDHFEIVTLAENTRRARYRRYKHCAMGHLFTPETTGNSRTGAKMCLICNRAYTKKSYWKKRSLTMDGTSGTGY